MKLPFRFDFLFLLLFLCTHAHGNCMDTSMDSNTIPSDKKQTVPKKSEFRAVWIATINNIDWPSGQNLSVEAQKREFLQLLDTFQKFNLNVVILQVRAASDAFYQSKTEPWSIFLTGKQGRAPQPSYDPLGWAIEMCHKRGMELHAWFNPFRVRNIGYYPLDPNSFAAKHPDYVKEFDRKYFLDPGYPEVRSHVVDVIAEVAHNYNIDAVLLDDYFYPYPVEGKRFSDEKSFSTYGKEYYPKRLKPWRRENINNFVSSVHDTLQKINPKIKFGVSPFGIWRNKSVDPEGSSGLRGISSFDDLYADVRKWLMKGWIDYVIPQLYWEKGNHFGDFTALVKWWSENSYGKPLYIGQALYKSTAEKNGWSRPDEISDQINYLRTNDQVRGFAFFSASNLSELTSWQVRTLWENQLNTEAAIDDDRHATVNGERATTATPVPQPLRIATLDERFALEFQSSLENNPISIREIWKSLTGVKPSVRQLGGNKILSWKAKDPATTRMIALVGFTKTGERRYRQTILGFSKTSDFTIPDQKWKELKGMQLILVSRDLLTKEDEYSVFFRTTRKKIKSTDSPFGHH